MPFTDLLRRTVGRLHYQIVLPLIGATAVVGLIASSLGIVIVSGIVDRWVDEDAVASAQALTTHFDEVRYRLTAAARLISEDPRLTDAIASGSSQAVTGFLIEIRPAVGADSLIVLSRDGKVVASTGELDLGHGEVPFPEDAARWGALGMAYTTLLEVDGVPTVTSLYPVDESGGYRVAVSLVLDDEFLAWTGTSSKDAFCYVDSDGQCLATTAGHEDNELLHTRQWLEIPEIVAAFEAETEVTVSLEIGDVPYRVRTLPLRLEDDPTDNVGYIVAVVDGSAAADTREATIRLIAFWSMIAIAGLWILGLLIARRVSRPIEELTAAARHVADGDYTRKVSVSGAIEIVQLADAYNEMTDSLCDRNDSLTKKILEMATLYEMSRLLGATLELESLLDSVLDSVLRIFNVESGYVIIREKETGELKVMAWRGAEIDEPANTKLKSSISEWVVREGRPLIFNPARGDLEHVRADSITGSTTALCVPLISSEGPIGAIMVGSKDRSARFTSDDVRLLSTVANHATIAIGNIELFSSLQDAYLATVRSLAAAVDAKDAYTRGHSDRVAIYAMGIAEKLELSTDQYRTLEMAAHLHDIGKIGVRESILLKSGKLDSDEMGEMRHHPLIGASILRPVVFPWPVAPIIRHHHEHWDGSGYPAGLRGEEIPLLARILTVSDAYEAMTADRPYRTGRSRQDAVAELQRCVGTHFDPKMVEAFIETLDGIDVSADEHDTLSGQIERDEARAVFAAVCDGMFASFRRLGGPRLASNVERDLNAMFESTSLPASYSGGRVFYRWDDSKSLEDEMEQLRAIVALVSDTMGQYSGATLVDHFYREALGNLSERLKTAADTLEFRPRS